MKYFIIAFSIYLSLFSFLLNPQEKEIREDVIVTNVEIPLRVIYKENPVSGLKKSDFKLYVNDKPKEINGFYEEKRKINIEETEFTVDEKKLDPRLFVLIFNMTSFHLEVDKGIDYFFENILKPNDKLVVLINNTFIAEKKVVNVLEEKNNLKKIAKAESKVSNRRLFIILQELESTLRQLKFILEDGSGLGKTKTQEIQSYLIKYLERFRIYKQEYLIPDINKYYNFAKYLDNRKEKKWVINFYQFEKYPKIKRNSRFRREVDQYISAGEANTNQTADVMIAAREVQKLLFAIDREMDVANDFPVDQVKQLFLQVNTTFHTIFMKSNEILDSEDYALKKVSTDIENSLREITKFTGGKLLLSNNLEKSLQQVSEKEDIFYVLSYTPDDDQERTGRIKITLKDKPYSILYNKNVYEDFFKHFLKKKKKNLKEIKIENLTFRDYVLSFDIKDFEVEKDGNKKIGKITIRIKIVDIKSNIVFDQKKSLAIREENTKISIRFKKLEIGEYNAIVSVTDLLNGTNSEDQTKLIIK